MQAFRPLLDPSINAIGADGAGRLAAVQAQCRPLAHLDLSEAIIADAGGFITSVIIAVDDKKYLYQTKYMNIT